MQGNPTLMRTYRLALFAVLISVLLSGCTGEKQPPLDFTGGRTLLNNRGVIVTNGLTHDAIIESIRALDIV